MSIRTFLLDDEPHCLELLALSLESYCPEVEVVGSQLSPVQAQKDILALKPDLLILDVQMPGMTGFQLLESLEPFDFQVIFSTAYDQFAIEALRNSALDYLLKPLDEMDLMKAISRVKKHLAQQTPAMHALPQAEANPNPTVSFPSATGLEFIALDQIIYCKSDSNYCHIILEDGQKMLISRTLKDVEGKLPPKQFFRVHHSFLINLAKVKRYLKTDGGLVQMNNGDMVKISRNKKDQFLALF